MTLPGGMGAGGGIGAALIRIGVETREMQAQLTEMNARLKGEMAVAENTVQKSGAAWGKAFTALKVGIVGVGVAVAAFAVEGVKAAGEFDKAMGKVYALTGVSKQAMEDLSKEVLAMSGTVPQGPTKLAEGLYYVISAGFSASDAMKILEISAKSATAGLTDTQTVADGLTSAIKAYSGSAEDAAHFADIMTNTVTQGKMEWDTLARAIGAVSVQGSAAGVKFEEVASAIATMTRNGLPARRASQNLAFLLRSLAAPTESAKKEMKALGVTFDENTLKTKGLLGTLQMFSKAAGEHHDVIVRNKKGQIDLAKSVDATAKANQGWFSNMKKMTGGAAGFLVSTILLKENSKDYKQILDSMAKSGGLAAESFEKMKEADPGLAFDLFKNKVQALAITFGQTLEPYLVKVVNWLADTLPAAMKTVGDVWNNTLAPAFSAMAAGIGDLLGALGQMLFGWQGASKRGDAFGQTAKGLGATIAAIAKDIGAAASALAAFASNPVIQALGRVLALLIALRVAASGFRAIVGGLNAKSMGLGNMLTGGRLSRWTGGSRTAPMTPESAAMKEAAGAHEKAAAELTGSATALKEAATLGRSAAVAEGEAAAAMKVGAMSSFTPGAVPATTGLFGANGQPLAPSPMKVPAIRYLTEAEIAAATAGTQVAAKAGALTMLKQTGTGIVGGLKSGVGELKGALGGMLGFVGKAFWPVMVASLATEFLKAPIGDLIASNTKFKRVGEKMKEDFFGGLMALFSANLTGSDLSAVLPTLNLGKSSFDTTKLGKFNLTDAQVAALQGAQGGVAQANMEYTVAPDVVEALKHQTGEDWNKWYKNAMDTLRGAAVNVNDIVAIDEQLNRDSNWQGLTPDQQKRVEGLITAKIVKYGSTVLSETQKNLQLAVVQGVSQLGLAGASVMGLSMPGFQRIAGVLTATQSGAMPEWAAKNYTKAITKAPNANPIPSGSALQMEQLMSPGRSGTVVSAEGIKKELDNAKAIYDQWQKGLKPDEKVAQAAATTFLRSWGTAIANAKTDDAKAALMKKISASTGTEVVDWDQVLGMKKWAQGASGQEQRNFIAKKTRDWAIQGATTGLAGAGDVFIDLFGKDIAKAGAKGADPKTQAALLNLINASLPKEQQFKDFDALQNFYKKQMTKAKDVAKAAVAENTKQIADHTKAELADRMKDADGKTAQEMGGSVGDIIANAMKDPGLIANALNGGANIIQQIANGVTANGKVLTDAIGGVLKGLGIQLPQSPVKAGPLKHPFLPNAGKRIVAQIAEGMKQGGGLTLPHMQPMPVGVGVSAIRAGGFNGRPGRGTIRATEQNIYVDKMDVHGDSDDQNILRQLAFLTRGGPVG